MTYRSGFVTGLTFALLIVGTAGAAYWLVVAKPAAAAKPTPPAPAEVAKPLKEDQILHITLKPEALERLKLTTGQVEMKPIRRVRVYGGEIIIPPGQTMLVA